jgi:hypothetical protein
VNQSTYVTVCAIAYRQDGTEYDQCYTWETAQTLANEGYRVIATGDDGHMTKEKIQKLCDYELSIAVDCFGMDHLK